MSFGLLASISGVILIASPALLARADASAESTGGASVSAAADDEVWYGGAKAKRTRIHRDVFEFGEIALDANDVDADTANASTRNVNRDKTWGGGVEFFAGRHFSDTFAVEARLGFELFDTTKHVTIPDNDVGLNFFIPYLDAGMSPAPGRSLNAGIFGVRYRDRDPVLIELASKYRTFDWGIDLVTTHLESDAVELQSVIGPVFAHLNQEYDYTVSGDALSWGSSTVVRTMEEIEEFYVGLKIGGRGSIALTDALALVGGATTSLFYHHTDLEARQDIRDGLTVIDVEDTEKDFSPRVEALAGFEYQVTNHLSVGAFYEFYAWFNAAKVVNPALSIVDFSGDNRWVGRAPAHLGDETVLSHSIQLGFTVSF